MTQEQRAPSSTLGGRGLTSGRESDRRRERRPGGQIELARGGGVGKFRRPPNRRKAIERTKWPSSLRLCFVEGSVFLLQCFCEMAIYDSKVPTVAPVFIRVLPALFNNLNVFDISLVDYIFFFPPALHSHGQLPSDLTRTM